MSTLAFDPTDHTYRYRAGLEATEVILPSVTQVMKDTGLAQDFDAIPNIDLDWYGDRGTKIHKACHLYDEKNLDESTVADEIKGYLDAYKAARELLLYNVIRSELIMAEPVLMVAGTLDKLVNGLGRLPYAIIDIKSGQPHSSHGIQLSGYKKLLQGFGTRIGLYGLYLRENGTFKLEDYTKEDKYNSQIFKAALTVYHAKRRIHGYD